MLATNRNPNLNKFNWAINLVKLWLARGKCKEQKWNLTACNWSNLCSEDVQACDQADSTAKGKEGVYTGAATSRAIFLEKFSARSKSQPQVPRQTCNLELGPPQIISKPLRTEWCLDPSPALTPTPPSFTERTPPTSPSTQYQGRLLDSIRRLRRQYSKTFSRKGTPKMMHSYLWLCAKPTICYLRRESEEIFSKAG